MVEEVARPEPPRRLGSTVSALVERWYEAVSWFGLGRLIASASAVLIVCFGAFWLVRSPRPPIEASLPRASTVDPQAVVSTLPLPIAAGPTTSIESEGPLTVHVAGAVHVPGVYELRDGDRIGEAIAAAGGSTHEGRPDQLNLAAPLVDGSRIHVPIEGEPVTLPSVPSGGDVGPSDQGSAPIDVNRASVSELETLPGVGPATAASIVAERDRSGPFLTVDDLERVSGIGPAKVDAMRDRVTV